MKKVSYYYNNAAENCTAMCGNSSCEKISDCAYAAFGAVCAFLLALMAVIIDSGAIISVIICVAIISIIICRRHTEPKEVFTL